MVPPFEYVVEDKEAVALYGVLRKHSLIGATFTGTPITLGELHDLLSLISQLKEFHSVPEGPRNLLAFGVKLDFRSAYQLLGVVGEEPDKPRIRPRPTWPLRKLALALGEYIDKHMEEHVRGIDPDLP